MVSKGSRVVVKSGSADITPVRMLPLFGRSERSLPAHSVKSKLEANILLIYEIDHDTYTALVTIDSLYASKQLCNAIIKSCAEQGLTLSLDRILLIASHTHNAPALDPSKPNLGTFDPTYLIFVADRIAKCLLQLARQPKCNITNLTIGHSECNASVYRRNAVWGFDLSQLQVSRRMVMSPNVSKSLDRTLKLAFLSDDTGAPQAILWTWPCHAVSEPDPLAISADFPGAVRDYIRDCFENPILPVLYVPGFSGDIRPKSCARLPLHRIGKWIGFGVRFSKANQSQANQLHLDLAAAFDRARVGMRPLCKFAEACFSFDQRILPMEKIRYDSDGLRLLTCNDWSFGPMRIMAVSAEVSSDYVTIAGVDDPLFFPTGCSGQVFGYLPTDRQLAEGGYEVDGFTKYFSVTGIFHDAIESKIVNLINDSFANQTIHRL